MRVRLVLAGLFLVLVGCGGEERRARESAPRTPKPRPEVAPPPADTPPPETGAPALDPEVEKALGRLHSRRSQRRKEALARLGALGDAARKEPVYRAVRVLMRDRNAEVRALAGVTLLQLRGPEGISEVEGLVRDEDEEVRAALLDAVGKLGPKFADLLVRGLQDQSATVLEIVLDHLARLKHKGAEMQAVYLFRTREEPHVRAMALQYLLAVESGKGTATIAQALDDLDDAVTLALAIRYVGRYGTPRQVARLALCLTDRAPAVRRAAAEVMGARKVKTLDAIGGLVQLLEDEEPEVRRVAHRSLRRLTAQNFGFDPEAEDPEKNAAAVKKWQAWFRIHGKAFAEGK